MPKKKLSDSSNGVIVKVVERDGDYWLALKTPYDEDFKDELKREIHASKREFDWSQKIWLVKITHSKEEARTAIQLLREHFMADINIRAPHVPLGEVYINDDKIIFDVEFDDDFVQVAKRFGGRYNSTTKNWRFQPSTETSIKEISGLLDEFDLEVDDEVYNWLNNKKQQIQEQKERRKELVELSKQKSLKSDYEVSLPDDNLELYPFQKYAVKMLDLRGKGLIADELGLGKTVETLAHLHNHKEWRPVIVIVPSSVKINWKREIIKWTEADEDDIHVLRGYSGDLPAKKDWYVINYAILHKRLDELLNLDYKAVVIDECHYIKNHKAERTKSVLHLVDDIEHTYCLSGTPMPNRPIELWTQIKALQPEAVDEFQSLWGTDNQEGFAERYCNAQKTRFGWDVDGSSNLDELQNKLRESIMIRRKKEDVLNELPEKRRIEVPLEIDNRNEYETAQRQFKTWMEENDPLSNWEDAQVVVKIEKLKQLAWKGKYEQMVNWLDDMLEQDGKTVVFAHHKELQKKLYKRYEDNAVHITGGMDSNERQDMIDQFSNDEDVELCIASLRAAGVGINLQVSSRAVFTEIGWTPSEHNQAEDRIHRIGQDKQVDIYYLMAENTIEEDIFNLINEKQKKIDEAIDGIIDDSKKGMALELIQEKSDDLESESLYKFVEEDINE